MDLIQLVPHLPPPTEGVGSYALALATVLRDRCGITTRFVVGDPAWAGGAEVGGCAAAGVSMRSANALADLLGSSTVLLHYSNYGYQPRGCPAWLVDGLAVWKTGGGRRLATFFHEVYASGPPWRSSFWTSAIQRRLAAALARSSEGVATSLELYARGLRRWARGGEVGVLPVFSTVGEPESVPLPRERPRRLIVFGGRGTRRRAYRERLADLESACSALGIEELCDVGAPLAAVPPTVAGAAVRQLGALPAGEVSRLMLDSVAGFLAYPPAFLAKSTVFAAYCAHGVVPVCAGRPAGSGERDGGPPFWVPGDDGDPAAAAARARAWYQDHRLDRQAEVFARLLEGGGHG